MRCLIISDYKKMLGFLDKQTVVVSKKECCVISHSLKNYPNNITRQLDEMGNEKFKKLTTRGEPSAYARSAQAKE